MRLALVAPLVSPITDPDQSPPIGGAQVLLADLAAGLARRGHAVTLLAADGSSLPGVDVPDLGLNASRLAPRRFDGSDESAGEVAQYEAFQVVRRWIDTHANEFDAVHAHAFDAPAFDLLRGCPVPVAHTLHLPPVDASVVAAARRAGGDARIWTVSEAVALGWRRAGVEVDTVVPNGVSVEAIPFGPVGEGYAVIAARVSPEKGAHLAIDAAAACGLPLAIVGGIYDHAYFARSILPRARDARGERLPEAFSEGATYLGPRPRAEVLGLMARATALLAPIGWEEAFGLTVVEAQAAGCPAVGFRRGALPEVVQEGVSGYLVAPGDTAALARALQAAPRLDRAACRSWVEARFDVGRMLERHEALYAALADPARLES